MAISLLDNFSLGAKKPNFARDLFDTVADMAAFSENYLPDVFECNVKSDGNRYRYNVNNTVDAVTGKWRLVSGGGGGDLPEIINDRYLHTNETTGNLEWVEIESGEKIKFRDTISSTNQPYLYTGHCFDKPDWNKINEFMEDKFLDGGCSGAVRNGKFYRSFDFLYNDTASFVIENHACGYKGMAGAKPEVTKTLIDNGGDDEWFDYLPFDLLDGINLSGIAVSTYILHREGARTNQGDSKQKICTSVLATYLLCNLKDIDDLADVVDEICVYAPNSTEHPEFSAEYHWMISDGTKTVCLEYVNNSPVITDISANPYITNFYLNNWDGSDLSTTNAHAQGIERWNILKNGGSLEDVAYTHTYSLIGTDDVWRSDFNDVWATGQDITTSTPDDDPDLLAVQAAAKSAWENRTRGNGTWHTQHACVYEFATRSFKVCTQENYNVWYSAIVDGYTKDEVNDLVNQKVNKQNPVATGSLSINRPVDSVIGNYSVSLGENNKATAEGAFAEGIATNAEGIASHTEGQQTIALGNCSHAEGGMTTTAETAEYAHVEGNNTVANNSYEHAEGHFNVSNITSDTYGNAGNTIHSIGIGNSLSNKKNAFEVMQNGDAYLIGVGDYDGTNPIEANSIQDIINNKGGSLSIDIIPNITVGGLKAGETISSGTTLDELFQKMLVEYQKPTITLSISPATTLYEKGTTISTLTLSASATKKSENIANIKFYQNSTLLETITEDVASGGSFTCGTAITAFDTDTTFKASVTDVTTGSTVDSIKTVEFIVPFYYGNSNSDTISELTGFTKDLSKKGNKTYTYTASNEYLCILYPSSYGTLSSIKDSNNFENIGNFNTGTVTISDETYRYYITKEGKTVSEFKFTFSF